MIRACRRCKRVPAIMTIQKIIVSDLEPGLDILVQEYVHLCHECRLQATAENVAAIARRQEGLQP